MFRINFIVTEINSLNNKIFLPLTYFARIVQTYRNHLLNHFSCRLQKLAYVAKRYPFLPRGQQNHVTSSQELDIRTIRWIFTSPSPITYAVTHCVFYTVYGRQLCHLSRTMLYCALSIASTFSQSFVLKKTIKFFKENVIISCAPVTTASRRFLRNRNYCFRVNRVVTNVVWALQLTKSTAFGFKFIISPKSNVKKSKLHTVICQHSFFIFSAQASSFR